jgi:hypothetical protein
LQAKGLLEVHDPERKRKPLDEYAPVENRALDTSVATSTRD